MGRLNYYCCTVPVESLDLSGHATVSSVRMDCSMITLMSGIDGAMDTSSLRLRLATLSLRRLEASSSALARNSAWDIDEKLDLLLTDDLAKI